MLKMAFFFFIKISNPSFPHLISTPRLFHFTKCSNPRLLEPPVYSRSKSMYVITFLWCPPQFIKKVLFAKYTCFPYIFNALTWYEKETTGIPNPLTSEIYWWLYQLFLTIFRENRFYIYIAKMMMSFVTVI